MSVYESWCARIASDTKDYRLVPYEIQKTMNFRYQFNKLNLRFKRVVEEALEVLKDNPTDFQGKIVHISNRKEGGLYRFRLPGCYLLYVVPQHEPGDSAIIMLTAVKPF